MNRNVKEILAERIATVRGRIAEAARISGRDPASVTLIGVTKTASLDAARAAFELGLRDLGESKPQELWKKVAALPDARWHLIGHLQRNKVDRTIPLVSLVHSADSLRLIEALSVFGTQRDRPVPTLLEVNCSREASKGGFSPSELDAVAERCREWTGVMIQGLMTMAAYSDDPETARPSFAELRELRDRLRSSTGWPLPELSMGMSNDYFIGVEEGATLVRVGTIIFEGL